MSESHDGPCCESCIQDGEYGFDSDYCCCEALDRYGKPVREVQGDWQIPHGLANRVRDATYKDAWEREIERTVELRGILTDLIAELRDMFGTDAEAYGEHIETFPIGLDADEVRDYLDRAERRLREVEDE